MSCRLLFLLALTLALACSLPASTTAQGSPQEADGVFRGWFITSVAAHPTAPLLHVVDQGMYVHTINLTDGSLLRQDFTLPTNRFDQPSTLDYLTVDRYGNTYALTSVQGEFGRRDQTRLLALDAQLQQRYTIDLPRDAELLDRPVLLDSRGLVYLVARLPNRTHLVYVYDADKLIDTWSPPQLPVLPDSSAGYAVTMDAAGLIYFAEVALQLATHRMFVYTQGGILADRLSTTGVGCSYITSFAVTKAGNIALVCDGQALQLLNANGVQVPWFSYVSDGTRVSSLTVDYRDTLLLVTPDEGGAVVAVSADGAGAKYFWRPLQSSFVDAGRLTYDRRGDSLLTWSQAFTGQSRAVRRVSARDGVLQDVLPLPARLTAPTGPFGYSNCFVRSLSVGSRSGLLYHLLSCAAPYPHLELYVTTAAGVPRREVTLMPYVNRGVAALPLVVDEDADVAIMALYGAQSRIAQLFAYSLSNATQLYNRSLGLSGQVADLTPSVNRTVVLTLPTRLLVVDVLSGATVWNATAPDDSTRFGSAVYDGMRWFVSVWDVSRGGAQNGSVVVMDRELRQLQAVLVVGGPHQVQDQLYSIVLGADDRVYALDRNQLVAYWRLRMHDSTTATATDARSGATSLRQVVAAAEELRA